MEVPSTERTSHTLTHTHRVKYDLYIGLDSVSDPVHMKPASLHVSPLPIGRQPDVEFICVRDDSLDEHLLVVSLSVRT